ncbi:putative quinol monooxygenase [Companilactobacillus heilongjiangensis]|uniref:putative quinol monooxygenase n=1 Tax=Companilactobacillus heilongjiangensis TaxID=1074467 RepID=UPI00069DE9B8|nr:antibiotic biosynthesis monooxygenase [Companilactobacillus heilongjiangensis]
MKLTEAPILRMYHLTINGAKRAEFLTAGVHNLLTSHEEEPGTLAMYATHLDDAGIDNFVVELYQNNAQYEIHANSPQFKAYGQVAQKVVTDKSMQELHPQFLRTNDGDLVVSEQNDYYLKLTNFSISADMVVKFKDELKNYHPESTVYLATIDSSEIEWLSLELVKDGSESKLDQSIKQFSNKSDIKLLKVDALVSQAKVEFMELK